jgi:hypothetical protein
MVNREIFFHSHKYKVLLANDSHLCGYGAFMKVFFEEQFEVLGYVKPGASFKLATNSVKGDIGKLAVEDFLIICSGSNDTNRNVFHDVTRFEKALIKLL